MENITFKYTIMIRIKSREMLTGAPGALVKDTKRGNYIVIIAFKTV